MKSEQQVLRDMACKFAQKNPVATLATADNEGTPHAAAVHFVMHNNLDIYFTCAVESRKFNNLVTNPVVGMAVTDEPHMATLQLTGRAEVIEKLEIEQDLLSELWRLRFNDKLWPIPTVKLFESGATNNLMVIKIVPFEMTYANFEISKSGKYHNFFQSIILASGP